MLDDELEVSLLVAIPLFEATLLKELEDVWSGQITLAGAVDSLEHLHRAELGEQPLFIVET